MLPLEGFGVHAELGVGDLCVRCGEAVEDLEHIVHPCPAWAAERWQVELPASALDAPPCVKLHGLLPAPKRQVVLNHEPALVSRRCGLMGLVVIVATLTFRDVVLVTIRTLVRVSGCPCRG
eukprot:1856468-Amphidinium_carterae.1